MYLRKEYINHAFPWKKIILAILILVIIPITIWLVAFLYLDYWWFKSLGYEEVFLTNLKAKLILFVIWFLIAYFILWIFKKILQRNLRIRKMEEDKSRIEEELSKLSGEESEVIKNLKKELIIKEKEIKRSKNFVTFCSIFHLLIAFSTAWFSSLSWLDFLKFMNPTSFGITEPVFGNDISFYFFKLPFIQGMLNTSFFFFAILVLWQLTLPLLLSPREPKIISPGFWRFSFSFLSLLLAIQFLLLQYSVLYSNFGVVYGAGWTDLHIFLPAYRILALIFLVIAILCIHPVKALKKYGNSLQPILVIATLFVLIIAVYGVAFIAQSFIVAPSEIVYEKDYLERNIEFTRYGFDLNKVIEKEYPGKAPLDLSVLNSTTVKNIRILDWPPALTALSQKQELRIYYDFPGIDIDRYDVNGEKIQVLLALREINTEKLPGQAKTWVNEKLVYTHGYGLVISPVNQVDREGMPVMYVKNIPPQTEIPEFRINEPEIYYGELTKDYIITNTLQKEFDYPVGDLNVFTEYRGNGGIKLDSVFKRMAAAICLDPINIWFSEYITEYSRLHLYRNVEERVKKIAPFLLWDGDPYIYLENGKPLWMLMGIAADKMLPYSEPEYWKKRVTKKELKPGEIEITFEEEERVNYVRDSVKAIIDPLDGSVYFYVVNRDPLIETYSKIYPNLFRSAKELSENTKKHFKYPEDLFSLQAEKFNIYHMTDPVVFYNKEDQWVVAEEKYHGFRKRIEAYNVLIEIDNRSEFILMQPLTPKGKQNMIAWFAVFQNERYGEIVCYEFPKGELIYGPIQIEARVDQNPELSKLITLWGQVGSEVFRGNLLVIPVRGSVVYVEPLYLSSEVSPIPELRKVIVVWHDPVKKEDRIAFADTTVEAFTSVLTGERVGVIGEEINEERIKEIIEEIEGLLEELKKEVEK